MKIYLYYKKKIHVFYLPENVSGSYSFDVDDEETSKLINVEEKDSKWVLFETADCKIYDGRSYGKEVPLENNKFYIIVRNNINYLIFASSCENANVYAYTYTNAFNITVGGNESTATYNCPFIKDTSFKIVTTTTGDILLNVYNGNIFINKNRLNSNEYFIKTGDELYLSGVMLLFLKQMVIVCAPTSIFELNQRLSGLTLVSLKTNHNYNDGEVKERNLYTDDDYFSKAPRLRRSLEAKKIKIASPPAVGKPNSDMPAILTVGPMITMGATSVIMAGSSLLQIFSGQSKFKDVWLSVLTSVIMLISTLGWPTIISIYTKKTKKKRDAESLAKYNKYIEDKKIELTEERKLESEIIKENMVSVETCLENLKYKKLNFWDKRVDQKDFLVARIGIGNQPLSADLEYAENDFSLTENKLGNEVGAMVNSFKYLSDVPIGYSFYENIITAIMGDSEKCHYFVNNILVQLLTFYSYDELKIAVFTNDRNISYWNYVKYLNHNMSNDNNFRFFASNEENASIVVDELKKTLNARVNQAKEDFEANVFKPYYLLIVDDIDLLKKSNLLEEITELKVKVGFSIIVLESGISKLPSLCNNFIHLGDTKSEILKSSYDKQEQIVFKDEINYKIDMMNVAHELANIPIEVSAGDGNADNLPDAITFLEMLKLGKVEQINIMNRWMTNDSTSNLKAEVGLGIDGKLMYLDLHEKAHGPHGLIAGMTGSGKSEFIITWILSLCINFSPEDVAFILIDYKGGGLAFAFENKTTGVRLPHLTGTITNLDKSEINRTLVSIDSEIKRRQKIFNDARDMLGESTIDIYKYQGYYHEGKLEEPLPHLFIVCDEFAELKAQQPDFMDNLISVARIGRSLGVHLILATQKPSGVVNDQIWSNTKFRVCLKVQDASDSNEMLKKPDAASLKQAGRFYLQVGYDEYFALGQSGWCGAKYYPSDVMQKSVDKNICFINETGSIFKTVQTSGEVKRGEAEGEQLSAIMKEIVKVSAETNKYAKKLWLDNIPEIVTLSEIESKYNFQYYKNKFEFIIGEYDAPESQLQGPLTYDLLKNRSGNIIGIDSRENEAIISILLYGIMTHYLPNEISYYIIDYGSQNFVKYVKDPHCGGIVTSGDKEKFNNLLKLLSEQIKSRKKILAESGCEYIDYIKDNPGKMPIMLVVFNNYDSISEENEELFDQLGELLRDSDRYGIVYLFSSSSLSAVPEKYRQLMPFLLTMKLKDSADYSYIFNAKEKIEPRNNFGRGICLNGIMHEFQVASITSEKEKEYDILLATFNELEKRNFPKTISIPSLPDQVLLKDVSEKLKGFKRMPIGIEKGTIDIKSLNLTTEVGKVIVTNKLKNVKSFMNSFIDEVLLVQQNIFIFDSTGILDFEKNKVSNYIVNDFDKKIDNLMNFVNESVNSGKDNLLILFGLSKIIDKLDDRLKLGDLFDTFNSSGNSYILIVDEVNKMRDLMFEPWFKMVDLSEGLFIGSGVEEQSMLKISNYNRELSESVPNNYGYYIADGNYAIIKLIEFVRMEESEDDEE